jgi:2-methylcitrate dehydratase PrpD
MHTGLIVTNMIPPVAAGLSSRLAGFLATVREEDLPDAVRHEAKRALLNFFAAALGGCGDAAVTRSLLAVAPFAGPPRCGLIGRTERTDALTAAFINAISANVFDFDDTHPGTVIHPSAPVAPALLALAGLQRLSGRMLVSAFAMGVEVECRIGNAISPGHYARGWHITSTCGVFGSAVAVARCLGLDQAQVLDALGAAAALSSGLVEMLGTMAKSLGVGNAARNGMLAAFAAQAGMSGPAFPIEGRRGFAQVMGQDPDFSQISEGLGQRWEILRNTYKPYPCGIVLHPVIDACVALRASFIARRDEVEAVIVRGHPLLGQRANRPDVATGREAQVSAQHAVAVTLLTGMAGLDQFSDASVESRQVRALRARVRVVDDPSMSAETAEVTIVFGDRQSVSKQIDHARGSTLNPLSDSDLEDKLRELAAFGRSGCDPDALIAAVWDLDATPDAGSLIELARAR